MEIEVGEYVRLRDGEISKIEHIQENTFTCKFHKIRCELYIDFIIKHSFCIIDLIQVGDYVNGSKVIEVDDCEAAMREIYLEGQNPDKDCGLYFEQIKSVLTKEQYEANVYKLEE